MENGNEYRCRRWRPFFFLLSDFGYYYYILNGCIEHLSQTATQKIPTSRIIKSTLMLDYIIQNDILQMSP
jgi:hypothetical protein